MPRKKLKPSTRIEHLRRDKRVLKSMLEWSAREFRRIAEGDREGYSVTAAATSAAKELDGWIARVR